MRKLVPLCLVTLAMTVSACGDDEGALVPNDTPDGSAASSTKEDSGAGETIVDESTSTAATDAGDEPTNVVVDGGNDSGTEPVTDVDGGDSGVTSEPTTDGGPSDVDAGDGGLVVSAECASACAAAGAAECADYSTCETDICGGLYITAPNCIEEADAYLACMGTAPAEDFECGEDDKPSYTGAGCQDPLFDAWLACAF